MISMDITAPFLSDAGFPERGREDLRGAVRLGIEAQPSVLSAGSQDDWVEWLAELDTLLKKATSDEVRNGLWDWLRGSFTASWSERLKWARYAMFFQRWRGGMLHGRDIAGCFSEPQVVLEIYEAFVAGRRLDARILEARERRLSAFDELAFSLGGYALSMAKIDYDTVFDPFSTLEATAEFCYFRQFFHYLVARLPADELDRLFRSARNYHAKFKYSVGDVWLVHPQEVLKSRDVGSPRAWM